MADSWLKSFFESPWSASVVALIAALIGGGFSMLGSWLAMRGGLKAQTKLQHDEWDRRDLEKKDEWDRRDLERKQERTDLEMREQHERQRADIAAVRTVAIEALNNSIRLISFLESGKSAPGSAISDPIVLRTEFDRSMFSLIRFLDPIYAQQLTDVHLSAAAYEIRMGDRKFGMGLSESDCTRARQLSESFAIMFRTLGQNVFSKEELAGFEQTLRVAETRLRQLVVD
jgi:hypothetical protein